ncbi:calponin homology domain-containing protein, partial [Chytriomyces sp. MP71]
MTESKTELLGWLNDLLALKYTTIEQCGTGSAFCQIVDSIYGTVPLSRVKFDTKNEYDYVSNLKILQASFNKHKIEKNIPIDRLVKCRYSDNLEFLQWMKKYWDAFYPGGGYDAAAKRHQAMKPRTPGKARSPTSAAGSPTSPGGMDASPTRRSPLRPSAVSNETFGSRDSSKQVHELQKQVNDLRIAADTLERERNFYYLKLRDLEVLVLEKMESENPPTFLQDMQAILYATEEGFIRPK